MKFCTLEENEFRNYLDKSNEKSFLQTPEIAKLRERAGWTSHYVGVKEGDIIVGATMMVSKKRHFGKSEFYAPRGFLIDYKNKKLLTFFVENIKKYIKKHQGYELRIDPYVINVQRNSAGDKVKEGIDNSDCIKNLKDLKFTSVKNLEQVKWMYVIDIENKTEDEVLKNMKPNCRNIIRKTLKLGIEIEELSKDRLPEFLDIMKKTGKRKNFAIRNLKYFEDMYDLFKPRDEIKYLKTTLNLEKYSKKLQEEQKKLQDEYNSLNEAKYNDGKRKSLNQMIESITKRLKEAEEIITRDGKVITLSGSMFIMTQPEIIYLSSGNYEEYMKFNSQYLIQWEMIKYGIKHNFKRHNFYGISGNFDKEDKDYGIYEFKTGFNGYVEELIGEYRLVTSPVCYLIDFIHKIRR